MPIKKAISNIKSNNFQFPHNNIIFRFHTIINVLNTNKIYFYKNKNIIKSTIF